MADELSKRERQKQRKQAKRESERAAEARARRQRFGAFVLAGLVVAALIGVVAARVIGDRQAQAELAERAEARQADLGCTELASQPNLGAGHISPATPEAFAAEPPALLYPDRPTSSGKHAPSVVAGGVYDNRIDERLTTHNLEHGYVVFWYDQAAPADEVAALKEWAQERIDGDFPKIIVAPWMEESLPEDHNFAAVAWGDRQMCEQFDPDVFQVVLNEHHGTSGDAPERGVPAHSGGGQGVFDPSEDDVLFPPLGTAGDSATDAETTPTDAGTATDAETTPAAETATDGAETTAPAETATDTETAPAETGTEATPTG